MAGHRLWLLLATTNSLSTSSTELQVQPKDTSYLGLIMNIATCRSAVKMLVFLLRFLHADENTRSEAMTEGGRIM